MELHALREWARKEKIPTVETYIIKENGTSELYDVMLHNFYGRLGIYSAIKKNPIYREEGLDIPYCDIYDLDEYFYDEDETITLVDRVVLGTTLPYYYVALDNYFNLLYSLKQFPNRHVVEHQLNIFEEIMLRDDNIGVAWDYRNDYISFDESEDYVSCWEDPEYNIFWQGDQVVEVIDQIQEITKETFF